MDATSCRDQRLRQMFNNFIDKKKGPAEQTSLRGEKPPSAVSFSGLTDAEKQRVAVKPITEEEPEIFEEVTHCRPMYLKDVTVKLKWKEGAEDNPDEMKKISLKFLDIMKKDQLLERSVTKYEDVRALYDYFKEDNQEPTNRVVELLDKGIQNGLNNILRQPETISDVIDEPTRTFLRDDSKAKKWLLDTMLQNPQFVPNSWGGSYCMKREEQRLKKIEEEEAEKKNKKKKSKNTRRSKRNKDKLKSQSIEEVSLKVTQEDKTAEDVSVDDEENPKTKGGSNEKKKSRRRKNKSNEKKDKKEVSADTKNKKRKAAEEKAVEVKKPERVTESPKKESSEEKKKPKKGGQTKKRTTASAVEKSDDGPKKEKEGSQPKVGLNNLSKEPPKRKGGQTSRNK